MKELMLVLSVTLFFLIGCDEDTSNNEYLTLTDDQPVSNAQLSASYPVPTSLNQIERSSDLIIKGQVLGVQSFGEYVEGGDITSTITEIDVIDVFDGENDEGSILVAEPYRLTSDGIEPIGHYVPLESQEEYYFFLTDSGEDIWMINFMGFGKYHDTKDVLNQSVQSFSTYEEIKPYDFLSDSEANKYRRIKEEVLNRYGE